MTEHISFATPRDAGRCEARRFEKRLLKIVRMQALAMIYILFVGGLGMLLGPNRVREFVLSQTTSANSRLETLELQLIETNSRLETLELQFIDLESRLAKRLSALENRLEMQPSISDLVSIPLHRFVDNPGKHFYTTDPSEIGTTVPGQTGAHGYRYERIEGYLLRQPLPSPFPKQ